jgi:hypothetical protein
MDELAARLEALNGLRAPWSMSAGKRANELHIDWRYADATWLDHMRVHGMRGSHRLTLRLDADTHRARALESITELDWSAGHAIAAASLRWRATRGINFFQYEHGRVFGLQIRNGRPTPDLGYAYTFSLRELKNPIIALITAAGWEYRPVVSFVRLVGG